jgi:hypothetical protein
LTALAGGVAGSSRVFSPGDSVEHPTRVNSNPMIGRIIDLFMVWVLNHLSAKQKCPVERCGQFVTTPNEPFTVWV